MSAQSLIHEGKAAPRQTHVLLIGIGTYENLIGGPGPLAPDHFGLGQLTSPPASARLLADWFITNFDCPDRPLGTLRMLLSEASSAKFQHPGTGAQHSVPEANLVNTRAAVADWIDAAANPDDQIIFYLCGHGLSGGLNEIYPLRDFGCDDPADDGPLARAINLNKFAVGLETVTASNQLLILDTCRERETNS